MWIFKWFFYKKKKRTQQISFISLENIYTKLVIILIVNKLKMYWKHFTILATKSITINKYRPSQLIDTLLSIIQLSIKSF